MTAPWRRTRGRRRTPAVSRALELDGFLTVRVHVTGKPDTTYRITRDQLA